MRTVGATIENGLKLRFQGCRRSGLVLRLRRSYCSEEVEVTSFVSLRHVIQKQLAVTPVVMRSRRPELGSAFLKFSCRNVQVETPGGNVEHNLVSRLHDSQRTSHSRLGRHVQHHC